MYSYPLWYFTFVNIITASTINITDIRLFNLIKTKFGEKEAEEFVALVKDEIDEKVDVKHEFITKDIASLREDLFTHFASKEFVEAKISEAKICKIKKAHFIEPFSKLLIHFFNCHPHEFGFAGANYLPLHF